MEGSWGEARDRGMEINVARHSRRHAVRLLCAGLMVRTAQPMFGQTWNARCQDELLPALGTSAAAVPRSGPPGGSDTIWGASALCHLACA